MTATKEKKEALAKYPKTDKFKIIDTIAVPHPYCITPKHVAYASDHCGGMLGERAIRGAEEQGARCDICKGKLSYDEHQRALLVEVTDDRELKDISELKSYLLTIKKQAEADGFAGFAFKQKKGGK